VWEVDVRELRRTLRAMRKALRRPILLQSELEQSAKEQE
jgi:hypothetical protein